MKIGILAVQGDFAAHAEMLADFGADTVEVRTPADLEGCDGLILPGGESTTQLQFLQEEGLDEAIRVSRSSVRSFRHLRRRDPARLRRKKSEARFAGRST